MFQLLTSAVPEPTLGEEMAAVGQADLGDMAILRSDRTGVPGVIFISTSIGQHGPRVKWCETRPERQAPSFSVSIAETPEVTASSVDPRALREHADLVVAWVGLNRPVLTRFWEAGAELFEEERDALLRELKPLA